MEAEGIRFSSCTIGSIIKIVAAKEELHALLEQQLIMSVSDGTLTTNSHLLAISKDLGKNWFFVDAGNLTNEKIALIFPNYNYELVLPKKQPPVFRKNK